MKNEQTREKEKEKESDKKTRMIERNSAEQIKVPATHGMM